MRSPKGERVFVWFRRGIGNLNLSSFKTKRVQIMKKQNQEPLLAAHKLITRFLELVCKNDSDKLSKEFNITMKIMIETRKYLDDYFDQPYQTLTPAP